MPPQISSLCGMCICLCLYASHCVCLRITFSHLKRLQSWPQQKPSFCLTVENNNTSVPPKLSPYPIKPFSPIVIIRAINFYRSTPLLLPPPLQGFPSMSISPDSTLVLDDHLACSLVFNTSHIIFVDRIY